MPFFFILVYVLFNIFFYMYILQLECRVSFTVYFIDSLCRQWVDIGYYYYSALCFALHAVNSSPLDTLFSSIIHLFLKIVVVVVVFYQIGMLLIQIIFKISFISSALFNENFSFITPICSKITMQIFNLFDFNAICSFDLHLLKSHFLFDVSHHFY